MSNLVVCLCGSVELVKSKFKHNFNKFVNVGNFCHKPVQVLREPYGIRISFIVLFLASDYSICKAKTRFPITIQKAHLFVKKQNV